MQLVKLAAAVLNQTPLAWDANKRNILDAIHAARRERVSLLCLPELCLCGYGCEDAFHSPGVRRMSRRILREILPETRGMAVSVGLPLRYCNALFNTACLLVDGRIAGFVAKQHIAGDGLHYEPRWFKPWPEDARARVTLEGESYPIGDIIFDVGGVRIGFEICEDAWVAERTGAQLARRGADIIFNPSASHFAFGKQEVRLRFVLEGSRAFGVTYVYGNLSGNEAGRAIYDGGVLIASNGTLVGCGRRFGFDEMALTSAVVDVDLTRTSNARIVSLVPDVEEAAHEISVPFSYPAIDLDPKPAALEPWERGEHVREEEFTRAVSLALFDYMRKSRSRGFVVSLSGGADSAACATLVAIMVRAALRQLGVDAFLERLEYARLESPPERSPAAACRALTAQLLTCVYQSTDHSSTVTRTAARAVAEAIGATFHEFDIAPLVEAYTAMVSKGLERELAWERDDLALQNIQARARAPGVWMVANLKNALLLATSNRSEAGVGYTTMDGDTCGGLSPIAGIDKAFLRRWLGWIERGGCELLAAVPALELVNRQAPTAELRPAKEKQTDEADLMPYDVLEAIERAAIRDKKTPLEAYHTVRVEFAEHPAGTLAEWVERYFRLWCRNQWKRERYAPSFHIDDKNLDPKTWCRFPILSGSFERELAELREFVTRRAAAGPERDRGNTAAHGADA